MASGKAITVTGQNSNPRGDPPPPKRRHGGGSRHAASDRITLTRGSHQHMGWTLNLSRGGVRIVLEDSIEANTEYTLVLGEDSAHPRPVRVVWIQEALGGQIAGLQFLDSDGTIPPPDLPDPDT